MATKTYRIGSRPYKGHKPGAVVDLDLPEGVEQRALLRGSISEDTSADSLEAQSRTDLDALASAAGVEAPEKLENKAAVVSAIRDKNKE